MEAPHALVDFRELTLALTDSAHFQVHFDHQQIYNPGLAVLGGQLHLVARFEGHNRTWSSCPADSLSHPPVPCPALPGPPLRMVSFVVRVPLDQSLRPVGRLECIPYELDWRRALTTPSDRELGPEDPRVFWWPAENRTAAAGGGAAATRVFVATNGPPLESPWPTGRLNIRCMKMQQVWPSVEPPVDLQLPADMMQRYEKNWSPIMPLAPTDEFLFSRNVEPHEVLACSRHGQCRVAASTSAHDVFAALKRDWGISSVHLGTNAIRLPSGIFVAILHGLAALGQKQYLNFVYAFSAQPPYRIMAISREPLMLDRGSFNTGFVFTSGLTWLDGRIAVAYNVKDRACMIALFTAHQLLANMTSVE